MHEWKNESENKVDPNIPNTLIELWRKKKPYRCNLFNVWEYHVFDSFLVLCYLNSHWLALLWI